MSRAITRPTHRRDAIAICGRYRQPHSSGRRPARAALLAVLLAVAAAPPLGAQPAPPPAPSAAAAADEGPSVRVGTTIFADYTVTGEPEQTDADGNWVTPNAFNIARAYINVTGTLARLSVRVTPDITRETGAGASTAGNLVYRLKYAYGQYALDGRLPRGSWVRLGMQQTPWIDFLDSVYRYRFQGPVFEDREGYLSSADVGATMRYVLPRDYGDLHGGIYNGETYTRPEANDQKAFMIRGSVRPLPRHRTLRGLRLTGFYDHDAYVQDAERRRTIAAATFEHRYVHAGINYLSARDQTRRSNPSLEATGLSAWVTPRFGTTGWEGLLRLDRIEQEQPFSAQRADRRRLIAGVAYWWRLQGSANVAALLDYEAADNDRHVPARADERRWALHTLVAF